MKHSFTSPPERINWPAMRLRRDDNPMPGSGLGLRTKKREKKDDENTPFSHADTFECCLEKYVGKMCGLSV